MLHERSSSCAVLCEAADDEAAYVCTLIRRHAGRGLPCFRRWPAGLSHSTATCRCSQRHCYGLFCVVCCENAWLAGPERHWKPASSTGWGRLAFSEQSMSDQRSLATHRILIVYETYSMRRTSRPGRQDVQDIDVVAKHRILSAKALIPAIRTSSWFA